VLLGVVVCCVQFTPKEENTHTMAFRWNSRVLLGLGMLVMLVQMSKAQEAPEVSLQ
jgi:hypothetical protein